MSTSLALLAALLFLAAPAAEDPTPDSAADLERMQGDWMVSSMKTNGLKNPQEEADSLFRTIKDGTFTVSRYTKVLSSGTFKVDASQSPRAIDSTITNRPEPATVLGIYEFDGDKLRICNAPPGKPRPKDFVCRLGSQHTLIIWEREKK